MDKKVISLGHIAANCYMLSGEDFAIVIDPGKYSLQVEEFLKENKSKNRLILLTHAHFDHIGGALSLKENTNTDIAIGEFENAALSDGDINLSNAFHANLKPFYADILLKHKELLKLGSVTVECFHTPGHTVGGMCYYIDGELYSGDTLFAGSIGRTDFPGGDFKTISDSINLLYDNFTDETIVFPGHGEETTIGFEKKNNPFVRKI